MYVLHLFLPYNSFGHGSKQTICSVPKWSGQNHLYLLRQELMKVELVFKRDI